MMWFAKMMRSCLALTACLWVTSCSAPAQRASQPAPDPVAPITTPFLVELPDRIAPMPIPEDNPLTVEGVSLGRKLFYDPVLSSNGSLSCSSCHQQASGFSDPLAKSIGVGGKEGRRNSMPLFNLAWSDTFFWDGRAGSLEEQVLIPLQSEVELNRDLATLESDLQGHETYPADFEAAFPGKPVSADLVSKALAQFLRTIVSFSAPFDQIENMVDWPDPAARRGDGLFGAVIPGEAPVRPALMFCNECHDAGAGIKAGYGKHAPGLFTKNQFRNNGLSVDDDDPGRFEVTGEEADRGRFRVPSLRNLTFTGPFMHDGRFRTVREVLENYNEHVSPDVGTDDEMFREPGELQQPKLTESEIEDVMAFIRMFDDPALVENPAWSNPFEP